jgi:hypothetical protein
MLVTSRPSHVFSVQHVIFTRGYYLSTKLVVCHEIIRVLCSLLTDLGCTYHSRGLEVVDWDRSSELWNEQKNQIAITLVNSHLCPSPTVPS